MKNLGFFQYQIAIGRQNLFFKDYQADFFVLFQGKLYSLRKQFIKASAYLNRKIRKMHRVHVITERLNVEAFEKVLSCFYGLKCIYHRGKEVDSLMEVIKFIECKDLQLLLKKQIQSNFNKYNIFFLLDFSRKYIDDQLQIRCYAQLAKQNFQQFNYNRSDLLNCNQQIFKTLIRLHQKLKKSKKIKGITFQNLRQTIVDYNQVNSTSVDIFAVLTPPITSIIIQDPQGELDSPVIQKIPKIKKSQTTNLINSLDDNFSGMPLVNSMELIVQKQTSGSKKFIESCNIQQLQLDHLKYKNQNSSNQQVSKNQNDICFPLIRFKETYEQNKNNSQSSTSPRSQNQKLEQDNLLAIPPKLLIQHLGPFSKKILPQGTNLAQSHTINIKTNKQLQTVQYEQFYTQSSQRLIKSQKISKNCQYEN